MESRASSVHESQRCVRTRATLEQSERRASELAVELAGSRSIGQHGDVDDSNGNNYARLRKGGI